MEAGHLANEWELAWGGMDEKGQILEVDGYQQKS